MTRLSKVTKNKLFLSDQLLRCSTEIERLKLNYEADVCNLQAEISYLVLSLENLSKKYELSKKEIQGHISAMDGLLETLHYNEERVNSMLRDTDGFEQGNY